MHTCIYRWNSLDNHTDPTRQHIDKLPVQLVSSKGKLRKHFFTGRSSHSFPTQSRGIDSTLSLDWADELFKNEP